MQEIFQYFLKIIKENSQDERIIVPLYKTLDYLYDSEELKKWKQGIGAFSDELFVFISQDIANSKSISKLLALSGLAVGVFIHVSKHNKKNAALMMVKLMTHK